MRREGRREAGPVGLYRILEEEVLRVEHWSITVITLLGEYRRLPCRSGFNQLFILSKLVCYMATSAGLRIDRE